MNYSQEAWEEEQMSELDCESVSDLIEKVKRLDEMLSLAHEWVASNLGDDMELEAFLAYIDIGDEEE
jgi:hypothetical protein